MQPYLSSAPPPALAQINGNFDHTGAEIDFSRVLREWDKHLGIKIKGCGSNTFQGYRTKDDNSKLNNDIGTFKWMATCCIILLHPAQVLLFHFKGWLATLPLYKG